MNKLKNIIENLNQEELEYLKNDIKTGNMERLINKRLFEKINNQTNKICPVCHSNIGEDSLTLIFGPKGLRKKASFCALDCLEYFINKIKMNKY